MCVFTFQGLKIVKNETILLTDTSSHIRTKSFILFIFKRLLLRKRKMLERSDIYFAVGLDSSCVGFK